MAAIIHNPYKPFATRFANCSHHQVKKINNHNQLYLNIRNLSVPGFALREFRTRGIWENRDGKTAWNFYRETDKLDNEFPVQTGSVVGTATTTWKFEARPRIGGIPQTLATFVSRVDIKGLASSLAMSRLAKSHARSLVTMIKRFDRTREIDAVSRMRIARLIKKVRPTRAAENFDERFADVDRMEPLSIKTSTAQSWAALTWGGKGWGRVFTGVRGNLEEVAAFFFDFQSRILSESTGDIERVIESDGQWKKTIRRRQHVTSKRRAMREREFTNIMSLDRIDENTIIIKLDVGINIESLASGSKTTTTANRCQEIAIFRFTRVREKETKVRFDEGQRLELRLERSDSKSTAPPKYN